MMLDNISMTSKYYQVLLYSHKFFLLFHILGLDSGNVGKTTNAVRAPYRMTKSSSSKIITSMTTVRKSKDNIIYHCSVTVDFLNHSYPIHLLAYKNIYPSKDIIIIM